MKLAAFCDKDTAMGFRLAGLKEIHIPNSSYNEKEIWLNLVDRDDIGVIFITEDISNKIEAYLEGEPWLAETMSTRESSSLSGESR